MQALDGLLAYGLRTYDEPCVLKWPSLGTSRGGPQTDASNVAHLEAPKARGLTCMSYNVLLPNSKDGWWIYKYYREPHGPHTTWVERQSLLKKQIARIQPDVLCLQEVSELSFEEDFQFLRDSGYTVLLHEKKGRMRPATCWKGSWQQIAAHHKDRSLIVALRSNELVIFVINVHLTAGPSADRRLRQMHEALETVEKETKKMQLKSDQVAVLVCGDFNSQGCTAVRELLVNGVVNPDFRESGDPTEKGQEGKQITSKIRKHGLSHFQDAADVAFSGRPPATILAQNIDDKMVNSDGSLTGAMTAALDAAFDACRSPNAEEMTGTDTERFLKRINRELGRGSEHRFVEAAFEKRGQRTLSREDFHALYAAELAEGKFWGVEHDMREILGAGLAKPEGPCELRFDYIYFTRLRLRSGEELLSQEQLKKIFGPPWETLPNSWHPSDHLPVIASFDLGLS